MTAMATAAMHAKTNTLMTYPVYVATNDASTMSRRRMLSASAAFSICDSERRGLSVSLLSTSQRSNKDCIN